MRTISCAVCGKTVQEAARRQKYCPDCAKNVAKARDSARRLAKRKQYSTKPERNTLDTPENIRTCLNCKLPKCRPDSARCEIR